MAVVTYIKPISIQLKAKDINADNRNDMLEAELKGEKLEDVEFKPLYNPRLSLGTLDIANAKCMTSKKVRTMTCDVYRTCMHVHMLYSIKFVNSD